ncbi:hypothetical protein [Methylorubrum extorquens]|uniref:hypothetical protein n=1 Tax=Methylorubrum extorquens TaxID=408 RepID=UPI0020A0D1F2|nr:hypothetical protein [Methylorubrum extorquens]MCP1539780.1 hypothetical protein [Methylorubrum extorquens]
MRAILTAILQAIWWALTLPLALLGIQRKPTARDLAASLLSETPPAAAEPGESYPLGELIREHAERRYFGKRTGDAPSPSCQPWSRHGWIGWTAGPSIGRP